MGNLDIQMQKELDGGTFDSELFVLVPNNEVGSKARLMKSDKRQASLDYYMQYGRTFPDKKILDMCLAKDTTILDVNGESGIISLELKKFPGSIIDAVQIGSHYTGKVGRYYPVTKVSKWDDFATQLSALGIAPRSVFMGDPFDEKLVFMERWLEVLAWVPPSKFLFYFGMPRTRKGKYFPIASADDPEMKDPNNPPVQTGESSGRAYMIRYNTELGYWEEIMVDGHQEFNDKLVAEFTKVYDHGKILPGVFKTIPSIFEIWQKN